MTTEQSDNTLTMQAPARSCYVPVVVPFVENAAGVFGLGREEALKLGLATEEIFIYLAGEICRGKSVEIECRNGIYYACVEFRFSGSDLNLGGLNITSGANIDEESDLKDMGLLLASRAVDRLNITVGNDRRINLTIAKDKAYPLPGDSIAAPPDHEGEISVRTPNAEEIKELSLRMIGKRTELSPPLFFTYPGKVVDMVASGEYAAVAAVTARGNVAGGLFYHFRTENIIEIIGPFSFGATDEEKIEKLVLAGFLSRVARSKAIGVISLQGLSASLATDFEALGSMTYYGEDGEALTRKAFGRLLNEDPGAVTRTAAELADYLRGEYRRLALARELKIVTDLGETRTGASIFSAEALRDRATVILRPLWPGADVSANVERHVRYLREDCFRNLLFLLDLGIPWHAAIIPALLSRGFRPQILIPFGGRGDVVIFQYHET